MTYPAETPFQAVASQNITAAAASVATSLGGASAFLGPYPRTVRLVVGADDVRVQFGSSTVVASLETSMLVSSGATEVFTVAPSTTHIALIRNASTDSVVNVTTGRGA